MKHATQAAITQLNFFKNNLHFFWWYAKGDYICVMNTEEILENYSKISLWVLKLTPSERKLLIDMLNDAYDIGFDEGFSSGANQMASIQ